jgi:hypothetical protein
VGFEFNEKFIVWENQWDQCIGRKTFHKVPSTKNTWKNVVISTIFFGTKGGTIYLCNLGKLAKRGGGGYPQALPKVINLQGMLDLPKILALIEKLPPRS